MGCGDGAFTNAPVASEYVSGQCDVEEIIKLSWKWERAYETLAISIKLRQFHVDVSSSSLCRSMKLLRGNQSFLSVRRREETDDCNEARLGVAGGRTMSSGSYVARNRTSSSSSSSSSSMFMKFLPMGLGVTGVTGATRPSRRASASERLTLRVVVETVDEEVIVTLRFGSWNVMGGVGVREIKNGDDAGAGVDAGAAGKVNEDEMVKEGRRGGIDGTDGDVGEVGTSGRVAEGAGLGDGIPRSESRESRIRRLELAGAR